jgi:hypothetical protein
MTGTRVIDGIAAPRYVITFDNRGVGASSTDHEASCTSPIDKEREGITCRLYW